MPDPRANNKVTRWYVIYLDNRMNPDAFQVNARRPCEELNCPIATRFEVTWDQATQCYRCTRMWYDDELLKPIDVESSLCPSELLDWLKSQRPKA